MTLLAYSLFGWFLGVVASILPGVGNASMLILSIPLLSFASPYELIILFISMVISSQYTANLTAAYTGIPGSEAAFPVSTEYPNIKRLRILDKVIAQNAAASVIGSVIGLAVLLAIIPVAVSLAAAYGAAIQFGILVTAFCLIWWFSSEKLKTIITIAAAFLLSSIGINPHTFDNMNFGFSQLDNGLDWLGLTLGAVVGSLLTESYATEQRTHHTSSQSLKEIFQSIKGRVSTALHGTLTGFGLGLVPGLSYILSSTVVYQVKKNQMSKKNVPEEEKTLTPLIGADAAHCSGAMAMLLPFLAFSVPITVSEGVIYNILSLTSSPKQALSELLENWPLTLGIVIGVNILSFIAMWKLGKFSTAVSKIPSSVMKSTVFLIAIVSLILANNTNGIPLTVSFISFAIAAVLFVLLRTSILPFVFGVLTFDLFRSSYYYLSQLYF